MTPPLENTTSVQIAFYKAVDNTLAQNVTANLIDNCNSFDVIFDAENKNNFSATVHVDLKSGSTQDTAKPFKIPLLREMKISTDGSYSYAFEDKVEYSVSIEIVSKETGERYRGKFSWGTDVNEQDVHKYPFLFRENGGETLGNSTVVNKDSIENGSTIVLNVPLEFNDNPLVNGVRLDDDLPHTLFFTFDEKDIAQGDDNTEAIASYLPAGQAYQVNGQYTLSNNGLVNDRGYVVTATAQYDDGQVLTKVLSDAVYVIKALVIASVTAYGLDSESLPGPDKTGTGESGISNVMEVYLEKDGIPVVITPVNNQIKFYLSQMVEGELVKFYSATQNITDDGTAIGDDLIMYSITKPIPGDEPDDDQLVQLWTDAHPQGNVFIVTAEIIYEPEGNTITKVSNSIIKTFNNDIVPLPSVSLINAWIAASVTTVDGERVVNNDDELSMQGYAAAPAFALAGQFTKTAFFGSGQWQDLDLIDTKFKFEMSVNEGEWEPVTSLHLILGSNDASSDQENYVTLMSAEPESDPDGLYDNIAGDPGVSGPLQPNVYFMVVSSNYEQEDEVKVRVQIVTTGQETTWPEPTESNSQVVVHKVNTYSMTIGEDSEPSFTGSGVNGTLQIPINNSTDITNDYYLESVSFKSYDLTPSLVTENIEGAGADPDNEDGVFNLTVTNPSKRGVGEANQITYKVYYKIDDPNGSSSSIEGPDSDPYTINVADEPTNVNFTVSNYSYTTFHNNGDPFHNGKSSFQFDISFQDGETTSIDGAMVYFVSNNNDSDSSNNISETLVANILRSNYSNPITVDLQTTGPTTSSITHGVSVLDINGNATSQQWLNFRSGKIVIRPYKTPKIDSDDDEPVIVSGYDHEEIINNIPVIDPVNAESVTLTGGVIESYNATHMDWTNEISTKYPNVSSFLTVSNNLEFTVITNAIIVVDNQDESDNINEDGNSYTIDIDRDPSLYVLDLRIKVQALSDNTVYYSQPVTLTFESLSVDTAAMGVSVNRGSDDVIVKASMANYVVTGDESKLNVVSLQLVNNSDPSNVNPNAEGVVVLECTSNNSDVQPTQTTNTYALSSGDNYSYELAVVIYLVALLEAGVDYMVNGNNSESEPLPLTLSSNNDAPDATFEYRVARKPSVTVSPNFNTVNATIVVPLNINANGLQIEGLQGVTVIASQEGDHTNANDGNSEGVVAIFNFDSSQVINNYIIQPDADDDNNGDNIAPGETVQITDDDGNQYQLTVDSIDSNDNTTLTIPSGAGFINNKPILVIVVAGTRLGQGAAIKQVSPP